MSNSNIAVTVAVLIVIALGAWWLFSSQGVIPNGNGITPTTTPTTTPGGVGGSTTLPPAVLMVVDTVAEEANVATSSVVVMSMFEREWPDPCLGLPGADEVCAQVITPGYEVNVQVGGTLYRYRTNADGSVVRAVE